MPSFFDDAPDTLKEVIAAALAYSKYRMGEGPPVPPPGMDELVISFVSLVDVMQERFGPEQFEALAPEDRLGDAPVSADYHEKMVAITRSLDVRFNGNAKGADRETGFVLLVFPFNSHDGRCNFMSNGADRKDIVVLFKEMIARFEGQPETEGRA